MIALAGLNCQGQVTSMPGYEKIYTASRVPGLRICLLHESPASAKRRGCVLFVHGASFPSEMAFGFRMNGTSWMDRMAKAGYDTYALDFLGYGGSDRYTEMNGPVNASPDYSVGAKIAEDIDRAVNEIAKRTGNQSVFLIGHSWGATVCAYYAGLHPQKIKRLVLFAPFIEGQSTDTAGVGHAYEDKLPDIRVKEMQELAPKDRHSPLEPEVMNAWGKQWLATDPTSSHRSPATVRFPSGWEKDWKDAANGKCYYDPAKIKMPVLLIRGEWDSSLLDDDAMKLYHRLSNARDRRYVIVSEGTHVMHLEKARWKLYSEVENFLNEEEEKKD